MLVDMTNQTLVKFSQITPPEIKQWSNEEWLDLEQILVPQCVYSKDDYHFFMAISYAGGPCIRVETPHATRFIHVQKVQNVPLSVVLSQIVVAGYMCPYTLLEGVRTTLEAFLKLYNDLADFQVDVNNLAKEFCDEK